MQCKTIQLLLQPSVNQMWVLSQNYYWASHCFLKCVCDDLDSKITECWPEELNLWYFASYSSFSGNTKEEKGQTHKHALSDQAHFLRGEILCISFFFWLKPFLLTTSSEINFWMHIKSSFAVLLVSRVCSWASAWVKITILILLWQYFWP